MLTFFLFKSLAYASDVYHAHARVGWYFGFIKARLFGSCRFFCSVHSSPYLSESFALRSTPGCCRVVSPLQHSTHSPCVCLPRTIPKSNFVVIERTLSSLVLGRKRMLFPVHFTCEFIPVGKLSFRPAYWAWASFLPHGTCVM
jgi:hypothetical protein